MTKETLRDIKKRLAQFHKVVERISEYWEDGSPHMITMSVLLQNAAHESENCYGYSHEEAVKKLKDIEGILRDISRYLGKAHHFERWIADEVSQTIEGEEMMENDQSHEAYESSLDSIFTEEELNDFISDKDI